METTTTTTTTTKKISLKLLVNNDTNKVLFAEVEKDFVDFVFGLLALPIGSVIRLIDKNQMVGSLGKLYGSLGEIKSSYLEPAFDKNILLNPPTYSPMPNTAFLLQNNPSPLPTKSYYNCSNSSSHHYVTDVRGTLCPQCRSRMTTSVQFVGSNAKKDEVVVSESGYVKGVVTYMVMDDLGVFPMSTISAITVLNKFNVKDVGALEDRTVEMGIDEGLKLLHTSLHSTTVLSDVFLKKREPCKPEP